MALVATLEYTMQIGREGDREGSLTWQRSSESLVGGGYSERGEGWSIIGREGSLRSSERGEGWSIIGREGSLGSSERGEGWSIIGREGSLGSSERGEGIIGREGSLGSSE